jgi:O-antigen ligase
MKKNKKATTKISSQSHSSFSGSVLNGETAAFLLIIVYLIVEIVPSLGAVDVMGTQWLYLAIVNIVVTTCILINTKYQFTKVIVGISHNLLFRCYIGFFVASGISILFALNKVESLVIYGRFIISVIAFLNIIVVLHRHFGVIKYVFQAIAIIVLVQCTFILYSFITEIGTASIDTIISNLKENSGNKNILAAGVVIKLPFIIYCIHNFSSRYRSMLNITTLILAVSVVFILNARVAYLALFTQIFLFFGFCIIHSNKREALKTILSIFKVALPVLVAFIIVQALLQHAQNIEQSSDPQSVRQYGLVTERIASITDNNDVSINTRLLLWKNAINFISMHPFTGCGYGNWKIASVKYEKTFVDDFIVSKHVHNDFLEATAESGIIAGILFASLFAFVFINALKTWRSGASDDIKTIAIFSLISLTGYLFDAAFNFPAERPVMQVFFAFALAINLIAFIKIKQQKELPSKYSFQAFLIIVVFAGLLISFRVAYSSYQSMKIQSLTNFDFGKPESILTEEQMNYKLLDIPNLGENNAPVNVIKAWYLSRNQKHTDALKLIDQSMDVNPDIMFNEWLKSVIFYSMNKPDSSFYYAKEGFFNRPRNMYLYTMLAKASILMKDTLTLKQSFREYNRYRDDAAAWTTYIKSLFIAGYDKNKVLRIADSVANARPDDIEIQHIKFFVRGAIAFRDQDLSTALANFKSILKFFPDDYENLENIGLTYFVAGNYPNAIIYLEKIAQLKNYGNGKSEFYLGQSLINVGRRIDGCHYLSVAAAKNFPGAGQYLKNNCN